MRSRATTVSILKKRGSERELDEKMAGMSEASSSLGGEGGTKNRQSRKVRMLLQSSSSSSFSLTRRGKEGSPVQTENESLLVSGELKLRMVDSGNSW